MCPLKFKDLTQMCALFFNEFESSMFPQVCLQLFESNNQTAFYSSLTEQVYLYLYNHSHMLIFKVLKSPHLPSRSRKKISHKHEN